MNEGFTEEQLIQAVKETDWSDLGEIHQTLYCRCGGVWRGHHRIKMLTIGVLAFLTQIPCPQCGKHSDIRLSESDREAF